jgi:nitrogenase molybdenum-iron protein beta chain
MNSRPSQAPRNACAFHGALQTLLSIRGIVPIIHSTAGCGNQQYLGSLQGGCGGSTFSSGLALPSTNIIERQIIFGGGSRLREQIKNAVKVMDGELYAVVTGCTAEMVGDDIPAMVREAHDQGFPVIAVKAPGFSGSAHHGYQQFLDAILREFTPAFDTVRIPGLINIFGVLPHRDVFWEDDLTEIARLIDRAGLRANTLFGWDDSVQGIQTIQRAEASLVLSPWGLPAARLLEEQYGIPYIDFGYLPVGAADTAQLLAKLAETFPGVSTAVEALLAREVAREAHFLDKLADLYYERGFQKRFAVVGESAQVCGLVRFLTATLGLIPAVAVITDNPQEEYRQRLAESLQQLEPGPEKILYTEDQGEIYTELMASGVELVLGSGLEELAATALKAPLVQLSFPVTDRISLAGGYAGCSGALQLVEELGRAIVCGNG